LSVVSHSPSASLISKAHMGNTPYEKSNHQLTLLEPPRHFKADEREISDEIVEFRRPSSTYIPVPRTRMRGGQLELNLAEGAYSEELQQENEFINKVRIKIKEWRLTGYKGITKTSRDLLYYWKDENRENRLFICQIEALETLIYINEVAEKSGEMWIPAVNNSAKYGTWAMLEIQGIHETMNHIRAGMERGFDDLMPGTLFDDQ
jgi:hypothetical protein